MRAVARKLACHFRPPAMAGTPPSARPMWYDAAAHARDFSERYAEVLDLIVAQRIQDLGIPDHRHGRPDPNAGGLLVPFFPPGDGRSREARRGSLKFVTVLPALVSKLKHAIVAPDECALRLHDPRPCELAVGVTIGVGDFFVARQVPGQSLPGRP